MIRQEKSPIDGMLSQSLETIVTKQLNALSTQDFLQKVGEFLEEFLNRRMDLSVGDNIRWAIARKVIFRVLETCPQPKLVELMVQWSLKLKAILEIKANASFSSDGLEVFLLLREQTFIICFFEIWFRRIPNQVIKETVHKRLYGEETSQRELTQALIKIAVEAKSSKPKDFVTLCSTSSLISEADRANSPESV